MKALRLVAMVLGMIVMGSAQTFTRIDTMGGGYTQGASWGDYDNDGDQDLIVNNGSRNNLSNVNFLYRNDGDGVFTRIINTLSAEGANFTGGCWGDYDNDGDLDYFAPTFNSPSWNDYNRLFRNNGDGSFSKINSPPLNEAGDCVASTWVDYDNDGDLDLVVINGQTQFNYMYRNDGNGDFAKIDSSNIVTDPAPSISGSWGDIDNDGDMDFFVSNVSGSHNQLFLNEGNGDFTKVTDGDIVNDGSFSINGSWGDYNNDGSLDLFVSVLDGRDLLYRNNGDGTFERITSGAIVNDTITSGPNGWGDFDNDGDLDLFMAIAGGSSIYYRNDGNDAFTRLDLGAITNDVGGYRTSCDYDNDGDLDVLVTNGINQAPFENYLYRNEDGNNNNWVNIRLKGTISNTTGIGARVYAKATIFGQPVWQMREAAQMNAYGGHSSLRVHFGLGDATVIDSVVIKWPASNITEVCTNIVVNDFYLAEEGMCLIVGIDEQAVPIPQNMVLHQNYPNPFNPSTRITYVLPTSSDVTLTIYNLLGQEVKTLVNARQAPGIQAAVWDGRDHAGRLVSSGIYIYQLQAGREVQSRKMLLVR